jgi:uncharacterized membrane protein (TIGR02234 family)
VTEAGTGDRTTPAGPDTDTRSPGVESASRRPATGRRLALLMLFAGAALVIVAATQIWARIEIPAAAGMPELNVTGRRAAPSGVPIALAAVAAAFVMVLSGRPVRLLAGLGLVVGGFFVALNSVRVSQDSAAQLAGAMRDSLGLFTSRSELGAAAFGSSFAGARTEVTGWPWVAAAGGVLIALTGLVVTVRGWSWPGPGERFERGRSGAVGGSALGGELTPSHQRAGERDAGMGSGARTWDALSRGEDPT